ncbi:hypothetical protein ACQ1PQ_10945, partial [Ornithobacterium rhinotracheale]
AVQLPCVEATMLRSRPEVAAAPGVVDLRTSGVVAVACSGKIDLTLIPHICIAFSHFAELLFPLGL